MDIENESTKNESIPIRNTLSDIELSLEETSLLTDDEEEKTEEIFININRKEAELWDGLILAEENLRKLIKTTEDELLNQIRNKEEELQNHSSKLTEIKSKNIRLTKNLNKKEEEIKKIKQEGEKKRKEFQMQLNKKDEEIKESIQKSLSSKKYLELENEKLKKDLNQALEERRFLKNHGQDFIEELQKKLIYNEETIKELQSELAQKEIDLENYGILKDYEFGTLDKAKVGLLLKLGEQKRQEIEDDKLRIEQTEKEYQACYDQKKEKIKEFQKRRNQKEDEILSIEKFIKQQEVELKKKRFEKDDEIVSIEEFTDQEDEEFSGIDTDNLTIEEREKECQVQKYRKKEQIKQYEILHIDQEDDIISIREFLKQKEEEFSEFKDKNKEKIRLLYEEREREIKLIEKQRTEEIEQLIEAHEKEIELIGQQNEDKINDLEQMYEQEIQRINQEAAKKIKEIEKRYQKEIRLLNAQAEQKINELKKILKEKQENNAQFQESINNLEQEIIKIEQETQEAIKSLKGSIESKEKEISGLADEKKQCIQRLRAAITKQNQEIDSLDQEIIHKYEEDESGRQLQEKRLDDYSKKLKEKLSPLYPNNEILNLTCSSEIESLENKYFEVCTKPDIYEYWSCLFLFICKETGPCNSKFSFDSFLRNFSKAIYGAFNNRNEVYFESFAESIDLILINEMKDLHDKESYAKIIWLLQTLKNSEKCMQKFKFDFKNNAKDAITSITNKINESKGKILEVEVSIAIHQAVFSKSPTVFDQFLANMIISYTEVINNNMLNNPRAFHDQEKIEEAKQKTQAFDLVCEDPMARNWISRHLRKINKITQNKLVLVHQDNPFENALPSDIHIIKYTELSINEYSRCVMPKNKIRASLHNGTYLGNQVCIKAYRPLSDNFDDLLEVFKEIRTFQKLRNVSYRSNNFLKYLGTCGYGNVLFLVTEWYSESLADLIYTKTNLKVEQILEIIMNLLESFSQMIENEVLFSEVNPFFIVRTNDSKFKFLNFDDTFVKFNEPRYYIKDFKDFEDIQKYFAPEKVKSIKKGNINILDIEKANVYSLGLIFYQLITLNDIKCICDENLYLDCKNFSEMPENVQVLLKKMISFDILKRPTFKEALKYLI